MSRMIQIRHVPDEVHRKLKAQAASEGLSLSDYLLREVTRLSTMPTRAEMLARLARLAPVKTRVNPTTLIRQERDRR